MELVLGILFILIIVGWLIRAISSFTGERFAKKCVKACHEAGKLMIIYGRQGQWEAKQKMADFLQLMDVTSSHRCPFCRATGPFEVYPERLTGLCLTCKQWIGLEGNPSSPVFCPTKKVKRKLDSRNSAELPSMSVENQCPHCGKVSTMTAPPSTFYAKCSACGKEVYIGP